MVSDALGRQTSVETVIQNAAITTTGGSLNCIVEMYKISRFDCFCCHFQPCWKNILLSKVFQSDTSLWLIYAICCFASIKYEWWCLTHGLIYADSCGETQADIIFVSPNLLEKTFLLYERITDFRWVRFLLFSQCPIETKNQFENVPKNEKKIYETTYFNNAILPLAFDYFYFIQYIMDIENSWQFEKCVCSVGSKDKWWIKQQLKLQCQIKLE